jgi:hypothetical protein
MVDLVAARGRGILRHQEDQGGRSRDLQDIAREQGSQREDDTDAGPTVRLLGSSPGYPRRASGPTGWEWVKSTRRLAGLLGPLGTGRRQLWNKWHRWWCYLLDAGQLADLQAWYGAWEAGAPQSGSEPPAGATPPTRAAALPAKIRCKPVMW